jgi:hypothetical protein
MLMWEVQLEFPTPFELLAVAGGIVLRYRNLEVSVKSSTAHRVDDFHFHGRQWDRTLLHLAQADVVALQLLGAKLVSARRI